MKMPAIAILILVATASTGCFTTWGAMQASGKPGAWDERVREERVPLPGLEERLTVGLALGAVSPSGFAFDCKATQRARDVVYRSAFRYGSSWKKTTAVMFLAEAAIGSALLLASDRTQPGNLLAGGFFALDAIGTGALFFAPRKDIYRREERPITTVVREACPDGLALEIGGETFGIDAAGGLGELGAAALDGWMREASGSLVVTFGGRAALVRVGEVDRCMWLRARGLEPRASVTCGGLPGVMAASFEVPAGTMYTAMRKPEP